MWVTGAESKDPDKLSLAMLPQGILSIMPSPGVFLIAASFEPSRPLYRENALCCFNLQSLVWLRMTAQKTVTTPGAIYPSALAILTRSRENQ